MPKVEIRVTDEEKAALQYVADQRKLALATWARSALLIEAARHMPVQLARGGDDG